MIDVLFSEKNTEPENVMRTLTNSIRPTRANNLKYQQILWIKLVKSRAQNVSVTILFVVFKKPQPRFVTSWAAACKKY